jgi:hypothetical protein
VVSLNSSECPADPVEIAEAYLMGTQAAALCILTTETLSPQSGWSAILFNKTRQTTTSSSKP